MDAANSDLEYFARAVAQVGHRDALRVEVIDTVKYTHDSGIRFGLVYVERKGSDGTQEYVVWRFIRQAEMRGVKLRQKEVMLVLVLDIVPAAQLVGPIRVWPVASGEALPQALYTVHGPARRKPRTDLFCKQYLPGNRARVWPLSRLAHDSTVTKWRESAAEAHKTLLASEAEAEHGRGRPLLLLAAAECLAASPGTWP